MLCRFPRLLFVPFMFACSTVSPTPDPTPAVPTASATPRPSDARNWVFTPDTGVQGYRSTSVSIIELQNVVPVAADTVSTQVDYTLQLHSQGSGSTPVTGLLRHLSLQSSSPDDSTPRPQMPVRFTGRFMAGGLFLDSIDNNPVNTVVPDCGSVLNVINRLQQNMIAVPRELSSSSTWRDSTSLPACAGSVPSKMTVIRTYATRGESKHAGRESLLIERHDSVLIVGEGAQGQHRVTVSATGSGTSHVHIDRATGLMLGLNGERTLSIRVGSSGRVQEFRQITKEQTTHLTIAQ